MKSDIIGRIKRASGTLFTKTAPYRARMTTMARKYPFATLFGLLGLILVLIVAGRLFNRPPEEVTEAETEVKSVEVYRVGEAPTIEVQAQVEKSGVVTITALTPGVIQNINFNPGDYVSQGKTLVSLSTNYQGGNALALQSTIAAQQLQNVNDTYDTQKELIAKQREVAEKTEENAEELREITEDSLDETEDIISLNESILDTLQANIEELEETNTAGTNDAAILSTKQLRSQFLSGNNQLRQALRTAQYNADDENPPAELADLQRDIAIKQLEIQEKALDLSREVARLQYQLARVQAATMHPSAPFNATVQRVFVKIGQAVNPGDPLVLLSQTIEEDPIVAIAYVPREIALSTTYAEPSVLSLGTITYDTYPSYITQDAIQGTLYGIYFPIPDAYHQQVTEAGYIKVQIPIGYADTISAVPYLPIDSVYQTQDRAFVFVAEQNKAVSREVTLGAVTGSFVEVESGLNSGDVIILDRNIVGGDTVSLLD